MKLVLKGIWTKATIPVLASILILGTLTAGFSFDDAFAKVNKFTICHKPGTIDEETKEIPPSALRGHLGHGDTLGECGANTPPTIGSVTLMQDAFGDVSGGFGAASRPTVCDANGVMDADGDLVTLSFEWLREDGTLITTGSTLPIASVVNELVTCKVTPFDGTDFGASVSNSVTLVTLGA